MMAARFACIYSYNGHERVMSGAGGAVFLILPDLDPTMIHGLFLVLYDDGDSSGVWYIVGGQDLLDI